MKITLLHPSFARIAIVSRLERRLGSRTPTAAVTTCSTRFVHARMRVCNARVTAPRRLASPRAESLARVTPAPFSHEIALPPSHHSFLGRPRPPLAPFALWQQPSTLGQGRRNWLVRAERERERFRSTSRRIYRIFSSRVMRVIKRVEY